MSLAETIKNKACPVHGIHPIVEVIGNEITITCCCADFHQECTKEAEQRLDSDQITDDGIVEKQLFGMNCQLSN